MKKNSRRGTRTKQSNSSQPTTQISTSGHLSSNLQKKAEDEALVEATETVEQQMKEAATIKAAQDKEEKDRAFELEKIRVKAEAEARIKFELEMKHKYETEEKESK